MATKRDSTPAATPRRVTKSVGRLRPGSKVKVHLGARIHEATVTEVRNGRITVEIHIAGADDPLVSSYSADELEMSA